MKAAKAGAGQRCRHVTTGQSEAAWPEAAWPEAAWPEAARSPGTCVRERHLRGHAMGTPEGTRDWCAPGQRARSRGIRLPRRRRNTPERQPDITRTSRRHHWRAARNTGGIQIEHPRLPLEHSGAELAAQRIKDQLSSAGDQTDQLSWPHPVEQANEWCSELRLGGADHWSLD